MKKLFLKIILTSLFSIASQLLFAQDSLKTNNFDDNFEEKIITDRPDQSEAPQLTPKGFFQIEIGAQTEVNDDKVNDIKTRNSLYNTTLIKYGISSNFEIRLITEYANDVTKVKNTSNLLDTTFNTFGFSPITIGSKMALYKENGFIPEISFMSHFELPYFGSEDYKPQFVIPRFRFLFAHTLNDRFTFSYNLGAEWEDGTSATTAIYTTSLGISLLDNLSMFVESYGFIKEKSKPDHRVDGGFTYLLNNNIQIDCSGGLGLSKKSPDYFISAGLSFRVNAFDKERRKNKI